MFSGQESLDWGPFCAKAMLQQTAMFFYSVYFLKLNDSMGQMCLNCVQNKIQNTLFSFLKTELYFLKKISINKTFFKIDKIEKWNVF